MVLCYGICLILMSSGSAALGRAGLRRVWGLPWTTHSMLLPFLFCQPPLSDAFAQRFVMYVQRRLASDSEIVKCVTRYAVHAMAYGLVIWLPLWDAAFSIVDVNTGLLLMICLKCLLKTIFEESILLS